MSIFISIWKIIITIININRNKYYLKPLGYSIKHLPKYKLVFFANITNILQM